MILFLNSLYPNKKSKFKCKRLGRGRGTGLGKTCGKGHKGQKSRSGGKIRRGFEGGQTPFYRRIPKFGFKNKNRKKVQELGLYNLNKLSDSDITIDVLKKNKLISSKINLVKLILVGKLNKFVNICDKNIKVSLGSRKIIELLNEKI